MILTKIAFIAIVLAYPLIIYFGLAYAEARVIALILIVFALVRFFVIKRMDDDAARLPQSNLVIAGLLLVGTAAMVSNSAVLLQYYPVCVNAMMLALFTRSLIRPPSVIEQIARVTTPDLPEAAIIYTRKVTMVWCGFFSLNGAMSLYTVLDTNLGFWAIYNGMVSYSVMGLLLIGEYLIRLTVRPHGTQNQGEKDRL